MELNKENLFNEYIIKKQNVQTVACIFNVSTSAIKRRLKKFNIHKDRKEIFEQSKDKYCKTMLERYGTVSPTKNKEIMEKVKETNLKRYGVEFIPQSKIYIEKVKKTNLKKYGVEWVLQSNAIKEKSKNTILKKYGVDNPAKSEIVKNKMRLTCQKRYGVNNAGGTLESIKKARETMKKKYGVEFSVHSEKFIEKMKKTSLERFGVPFYCMTDKCKKSNGYTISKTNKKISELLKENGIENKLEKTIDKYSYDIEVLNKNIVLEINPTYTHNSTNGGWFNNYQKKPLEKEYHQNKTLVAKQNGYRCVHIWDWDDINKIINILKDKQKIHARKCEIKEIGNEELSEFENKYHLQRIL